MKTIDWEGLKMVSPGFIPPRAWNFLVDAVHTVSINSVKGGRLNQVFGAGTDLLIDPQAAASSAVAWNWKVYNTSTGGTGQVQVNGGDGFVATLNNKVANVNGSPNNVASGSPAAYPQLAVTGNGVIYLKAVPATAGTAEPLSALDVYFASSVPAQDTANPATYYIKLLATVTGYATSGGIVSFNLANATNYGYTSLIYCGGALQIN